MYNSIVDFVESAVKVATMNGVSSSYALAGTMEKTADGLVFTYGDTTATVRDGKDHFIVSSNDCDDTIVNTVHDVFDFLLVWELNTGANSAGDMVARRDTFRTSMVRRMDEILNVYDTALTIARSRGTVVEVTFRLSGGAVLRFVTGEYLEVVCGGFAGVGIASYAWGSGVDTLPVSIIPVGDDILDALDRALEATR